MTSIENFFFELLQVAIGCRSKLSAVPTKEEWVTLLEVSVKQSLAGITFAGVERLPKEQWPEKEIVFQWMAITAQIEQQNVKTTEVCLQLVKRVEAEGFKTCILKGQSNYAYYSKELKNKRSCGDIDIWALPKDDSCEHPVKAVLEYLNKTDQIESLCYLHAEIKPVNGVPVEVHFRPSFMNEPRHNCRFMNLFKDFDQCICLKNIDGVQLPVLKTEYDIIFQLCHLYRHLIDEGVGLRQVLDYYYLLRDAKDKVRSKMLYVRETLKYLGLQKFAGALMWVLREVFAMPESNMICGVSEKDGKFLLEEIMLAGNFGQSDPRMAQLHFEKGKTSFQVKRAWRRIKRNSRFLMSYPSEVIWEPIARIEHLAWRKYKLWNY